MTVVFYRLRDEGSEFEDIGAVEDGEIVRGEENLPPIDPEEAKDPDALMEHYDGPYLVAAEESDTPTDETEKTHWLTEPRMGKVGWYDSDTGAFRYTGASERVSEFLSKRYPNGLEDTRTSLVACQGPSSNLLKQDDGQWIPYKGPQNGEGWQQVGSGEVRYQQDPPGEVADGHEDDHWKQRWPEIEGSEWEEAVPNPIDMKEDDALLFINRDNQTEVGRFESATFIHNEDWDSAKMGVTLQDGREVLTDDIEAHADMTLAVEPPELHGGEEEWGDAPGVYTDYVPDNLVHFIDEEGVEQTGVVEGWQKDRGAVKVQTNKGFTVVETNRITHYAETDQFYNEAYNVINSPLKDSPPVDPSEEAPDPNFAARYGATTDDVHAAFRQIFGAHLVDNLEEEIETGDYDPDDPDDVIRAIVNYRGDDSNHTYPTLKHEIRGRAAGMGKKRVQRIIGEAFATETNDPSYAIRKRMRESDANLDDPEAWLEHAAQFAYEDDWVSLQSLQDAVDDWAGDIPLVVKHLHDFEGEPEEVVALSETGTNTGISAGAMFIAEWPDGGRSYITRIRDERESPNTNSEYFESSVEAERAMTGYGVQSALAEDNDNIQVPDHVYRMDTYFAVEGAPDDAVLADRYDDEYGVHDMTTEEPGATKVDRDDFMDMALGAVMAGNKDMHSNNVMVDEEGTLYPIDLDYSGYDMSESRNLSQAIGQLVSTAKSLGIEASEEFEDTGDPNSFDDAEKPLGQEILAHVNGVSSEVVETTRDGNPMWGARQMGDNIGRNAEAAKNGELEL